MTTLGTIKRRDGIHNEMNISLEIIKFCVQLL